MGTIRRFQELLAWQKARDLSRFVFELTLKTNFARDSRLRTQIRDSADSSMSNTAEGFGRGGTTEFFQYLSIAKASAAETQSHLYSAFDRRYVTQDELDSGIALAEETANLQGGLMRYLRRCGLKGAKYAARPLKLRTPNPELRSPNPRSPNPQPTRPTNPPPRVR